MPTASSLAWKTSLRKVRTLWHCSRLRSVALYLWLIIDIRQAIDRCSNIWASLPGAGFMVSFERRLTAWLQNSKKRNWNGQRDWCMSKSPRLSHSGYHIIVCLSWAVNHYRDNAVPPQSPARQKCQRTEAGERQYGNTMRQRDVAALDAKIRRS